ncbi:hypothetical protein KKH23_05775, partial [Patescibacteria group bacterium]|nr:hypothetical protein [Patescibacteria group bacterium]
TIDLKELERWLAGDAGNDGDSTEPVASVEPEPTEPEPVVEELPNDFHTFLLREHAERRAGVLAMLGEEVTDNG